MATGESDRGKKVRGDAKLIHYTRQVQHSPGILQFPIYSTVIFSQIIYHSLSTPVVLNPNEISVWSSFMVSFGF